MKTKRRQATVSNDIINSVVSKQEFKRLTLASDFNPENLVLISIQDPSDKEDLGLYREWYKDELSVRFWDVEEDLNVTTDGFKVTPISNTVAKTIVSFISKHKDKQFMIHCAAGQSRSSAVALAVESIIRLDGNKYKSSLYDFDIKNMKDRYCPNLVVYDKILEEYNKGKL